VNIVNGLFGRTGFVFASCMTVMLPLLLIEPALAEETAADAVDAGQQVQEAPTDAVAAEQAAGVENKATNGVAKPRKKLHKLDRSLMKAGVKNVKVGNSFMADNLTKPGVVVTKSGLQYKVIKAGKGARPSDADVVLCNYSGALLDGSVFELSEPGKPASMSVSQMIPGLKEALKLMQTGAKLQVFIPPELGFGAEGKMPIVSPGAVLVYDLELVGISPVR
jgi:FKBP-type peptidyl-prolyl cis-trans isomerase